MRQANTARGGAPVRALAGKRRGAGLVLATFVVLGPGIDAGAFEPGRYDLTTETWLPHLDEMRRIVREESACIGAGEAERLFPVLRQPALHGCTLVDDRPGGRSYRLRCQSERVAIGVAHLEPRPDNGLRGLLEVKMGGKNMTFSQRVVAVRRGNCDGP
jgi:hypothetical protein